MVDIDIEVVGDVKAQATVVVVIVEGAPHTPAVAAHARLSGHVGKGPVAVVVIQNVPAVVGDVKIVVTVVIVVSNADSHAPAGVVQTRAQGHIRELAVAVVAIKPRGRAAPALPVLEGGAIHQEQVGKAVVVVIDPRRAPAALGLDDVPLLRPAAGQLEVDTGFSRDFDELIERGGAWDGREARCSWLRHARFKPDPEHHCSHHGRDDKARCVGRCIQQSLPLGGIASAGLLKKASRAMSFRA